MKNYKIFPAFIIFLVLLITIFILLNYYSKHVSIRRDGYYEITSLVKGEYSKAEEVKSRLTARTKLQAVIERASKNAYNIIFGKFSNTYEAGKAAFDLFCDSLITGYEITLDGKKAADIFTNILFVSDDEGNPSLFQLNLMNKKISLIWNDWGEEVVSLEQSPDRNIVYFLTSAGVNRRRGLNSLADARLYNYTRENDRIKMVEYLKNGVQFYSYWNSGNKFMTSFTSLDSSTNQDVVQSIAVFDSTGEKIQKSAKKYNIIKDGFPNPPVRKLSYTSSMNKYILNVKNEGAEKGVYIKRTYTEENLPVLKTKGELSYIAWSDDDKYLFFIYYDIKKISKKQSKNEYFLVIYDADSKKIIRKFDSKEFRYLSVYGRILAVESGAGKDSEIMFYDYIKDKIYYNLTNSGGCVIKNLPLEK